MSAVTSALDIVSNVLNMPKEKLASISDANLNLAINTATLAKSQGVSDASRVLAVLKAEQSRRSGTTFGGGGNTKLYLLGGAGLVAVWFLFIRK
jgi:hypothetical protein